MGGRAIAQFVGRPRAAEMNDPVTIVGSGVAAACGGVHVANAAAPAPARRNPRRERVAMEVILAKGHFFGQTVMRAATRLAAWQS